MTEMGSLKYERPALTDQVRLGGHVEFSRPMTPLLASASREMKRLSMQHDTEALEALVGVVVPFLKASPYVEQTRESNL